MIKKQADKRATYCTMIKRDYKLLKWGKCNKKKIESASDEQIRLAIKRQELYQRIQCNLHNEEYKRSRLC